MAKKATHVQIWKSSKTNSWMVKIASEEGNILLDIGPNDDDKDKVVKLLKEEFGGAQIHSN